MHAVHLSSMCMVFCQAAVLFHRAIIDRLSMQVQGVHVERRPEMVNA
jgi:hypothetical protein